MKTNTLNDVKAIIIGASGSFFMFLILAPLIVLDKAPFNLPPPSAFLEVIGFNIHPFPWVVHFAYGIFCSILFARFCAGGGSLSKGVGLSLLLWLGMMVIYSPMIGWGFFGLGEAHLLSPEAPLYLAEGYSYAGIMLVLHLVYGATIGWLNPLWQQVDTL